MSLLGIVAVSGKPGLFKLIGQNKTGYVIESLDDKHAKQTVSLASAKLAALHEITIYCVDEDARLRDVLKVMEANEAEIPDAKAPAAELRAWFNNVLPNHDEERVYQSDLKKIISWYHLLKEQGISISDDAEEAAEENAAASE